jgi:acetaldehyde dehydrogenase
MSGQHDWPVAIIGSGSIGTDLMLKVLGSDGPLTMGAMVDVDPLSDGLARAARMGVPTTAGGVDGLLGMPNFADIKLVFDASSAEAHHANWARLADTGVRVLDLTPAAIGPYCVPVVNLDEHLDAPNLNLATCGGQATVPIVAAVAQSGIVCYAEVVSSISAKSAGSSSRAGVDDFTETTAAALRVVGGAQRAKSVMILNPADPPILMRNTVFCLVDGLEDGTADLQRIETDILAMIDMVRSYVPGYRLKHRVQFEMFSADHPLYIPETGKFTGARVTVLLEVADAAHHLPAYAGNIDIMTSAAKVTAERIAVYAGETTGAR